VLKRLPLTLKISLVVALAVGITTAALATTVLWAARSGFGRYLSVEVTERTDELRPVLEAYYAAQGNWVGADQLMAQQHTSTPGMGRRGRLAPGTTSLMLVDAEGGLAYVPPGAGSSSLPARLWRSGVPLSVGGEVVGYLVVLTGVQENAFYRTLLLTILRAGGLTAVLALGLGLFLTRRALGPLSELEAATGKISAGDLAVRVPVHAHDEVGALASRFNTMASALQEQESLRQRMMNDIAHELRTPLTIMQGQLEALQDGVFPLDAANLEPVHEQTLLLNRLVGDLRDLALAEAGQIRLAMASVDISAVSRRVASRFLTQAQSQGIALQVHAGDAPPVRGDAQRLEQVLGNLLSNALRHTPQGGSITIEVTSPPGALRIAVHDTGEGIPAEDLPHVFERFYRGDRSRQRGSGQSGLGLAIARELVRAHGGEISAHSFPGQGTTITIELPAEQGGAEKQAAGRAEAH